MKIIKRGEAPIKEVEETCDKCKTVFVYDMEDVNQDQRDGNYVMCPVCKSFITSKL